MDDTKVVPTVQEPQKNSLPDLRILISGGKRDNDGIEGDADFNPTTTMWIGVNEKIYP